MGGSALADKAPTLAVDDLLLTWNRLQSDQKSAREERRAAQKKQHAAERAALSNLDAPQEDRSALLKILECRQRREVRDLEDELRRCRSRLSAEEEARARMAASTIQANRRSKNLLRFGYWNMPALNLWIDERNPIEPGAIDEAVHRELEEAWGNQHRDGNPSAVFEFARQDAWCFRSAWFVEQLEQWRDDGEDRKLLKVIRCFARNRSKTPHAMLYAEIIRDQAIFREIVRRKRPHQQGRLFGELANEFNLSEESISLINDEYRPYLDEQTSAGVSVEEFFERLAEMAKRIPPT
jgi:hypothetical protein